MITGDRPRMLPAELFHRGLERSLPVVMRLLVGRGSASSQSTSCTAWLVTPRIVVAPGYALLGPGVSGLTFVLHSTRDGMVRRRNLLDGEVDLVGNADSRSIVLLKLEASVRSGSIELLGPLPDPGSMLSLLSYPRAGSVLGLSIGTVLSIDDFRLTHDADSEAGSGGGPLFDSQWRLIGMHVGSDSSGKLNEGLSRTELVNLMRRSRFWPEVARHHRLADVVQATGPVASAGVAATPANGQALLLRAALTLRMPRSRLTTAERGQLQDLVIDVDAEDWTLQPAVRREAIKQAGSLEALRPHAPRGRASNAGQQVIARILAGPDYKLETADEEQLSWWLQAVRWFDGVAPGLPSAATVNRILQRRRVRSQLARVAGPDFAGRTAELKRLKAWFATEPATVLSLTGVGGVGKSALVARFAQQLPTDTLLLWLDFDRPDVAPDDALSVVDALHDQAQRQIDTNLPKRDPAASWQVASAALGAALAKLELGSRPLLVLDSFEVAQYALRYQEVWPVLERVAERLRALRVVVSGRAPVPGLSWLGRPSQSLHLSGLRKQDARSWLGAHGIRTDKAVDTVFALSRGLPLILRLAHRYVETGGRIASLPKDLPLRIRAGFLYGRILDRIYDPALKPLAIAVLVLRRVTADMLDPIFKDLVKAPPGAPADWFAQLRREAAFVEGTDVLQVRPELRAAALDFIEAFPDGLDIRLIERRAIAWYRTQDSGKPELGAELVYHLLRTGDLTSAHAVWRDGFRPYLQHADDTLMPKARKWLRQRLGTARLEDTALEVWEYDAASRVRAARGRGLGNVAAAVLAERKERSVDSPLLFHDAYELRAAGAMARAIEILGATPGARSASVRRERTLLSALLHSETGHRDKADELLAPLDRDEVWSDRPDGILERAALSAVRIQLATDLAAEQALLASADTAAARRWLRSWDLLLPALEERLATTASQDGQQWALRLPQHESETDSFLTELRSLRRASDSTPAPERDNWLRGVYRRAIIGDPLPSIGGQAIDVSEAVWSVFIASQRRWAMLAHGHVFTVLPQMIEARALSPLQATVLGSQALFVALRGLTLQLPDERNQRLWPVTPMVLELIERNRSRWLKPELLEQLQGGRIEKQSAIARFSQAVITSRFAQRAHAIAFFQSVPDPLALLVDRFAGRPEQESRHA